MRIVTFILLLFLMNLAADYSEVGQGGTLATNRPFSGS
jgi:hypothetical protein